MDMNEQIEAFKDFFDDNYKNELYTAVMGGKRSLSVDFAKLAEHNPNLAELLIQSPEDLIKSSELSIENFDLPKPTKHFKIRYFNLPVSQRLRIADIRSEHLGMFIWFESIVRQSSDIRPQVTNAKFECAGCGNTISILQIDTKFKEPSRCTCGWRGKFRLLSKDLVDVQHLKVEEAPESLEGGEQPKRLSVFLQEDLVEAKMEKRTAPGAKILVYGIVKEIPIQLKTGAQSTRYDIVMEANNIVPVQEDFSDLVLNEKDVKAIIEFSKDPKIYEKFTKAIAPSIYGHEKIKQALILQLMGGVRKVKEDKTVIRGDIHVLLVGDPGAGKSAILSFIAKAAPKARFVSGKGSTGTGLCIAPDSLITTNPGGIHKIKDLVESKLINNFKLFKEGVLCANDPESDKKIFTLDENLRIEPQKVSQFWKIAPPSYMVKLITSYGKEIIATPNTKLFSIQDGCPAWKEADSIISGEYLAGCRQFKFENNNRLLTLSLIKSNPIVYGVKKEIFLMIQQVCKARGLSIRELSREINVNENQLYFNWVNENARGNIHLHDLLVLARLSNYKLENVAKNIKGLSFRKGHRIRIPLYINEDFMYLAGLIAGDGDIYANKNKYSIRFSNNSAYLQKRFNKLVSSLFNIKCNLSSLKSAERAEAWRFGSKLIVEILNGLGIINSPKSSSLDMKNTLLTLPNNLLASYLCGYFDADGGPSERFGTKSIEACTASREFAKKLQLVLLRFGIQSKLRLRQLKIAVKKNGTLIVPKNNKYVITIYGKSNFELFKDKIGFKSIEKKEKLDRIIKSINKYHSNKDVLPGAGKLLKSIITKNGLTTRQVFGYKTSRYFSGDFFITINNLKKIISKLESLVKDDDIEKLKLIVNSDIIWEKVVKRENIYNHGYDFVYDLTVENSHNFVVNGLVVHNTAAVVKDEFLKGWSLEAGALVLANKGIAVVDELDKMTDDDRSALHEALEQQCMLPDFKLMLSNGTSVKIGDFVDNLIDLNKDKVYARKDCEILTVNDVELLSTDFTSHFSIKAARVSRHIAPAEFVKVELTNGKEITVTPEHPCWIVDNGKITTIPAEKLTADMYFPIPSELKTDTIPYNSNNNTLCKILGYHLSDGCYELNRGKKVGIQFWNNDEILIKDYKESIEKYFKVKPGITKRKHQFAVRVISKKVFEEIRAMGGNLIEKGDTKKIPDSVMQFPNENLKYLLAAIYDGDGTVVFQKRGGCRVSLVSQNRELMEQVSDILLRFSIQSSIFKDKTGHVWILDVSGQENLSKFLLNITFLSKHKRERLEEYCSKDKTYRSIKDVVPNCTNKINKIFKELKISARKEIGHSIDLGVEKHRLFLQKLVRIAINKAIQIEDCDGCRIRDELREIEKLAFGYARWMKIKKVSKLKNEGIKWVYDVTVEPYHTFISNGMILHNTVTISKANIQASLRAETTMLAAANPKLGRFDPYAPIASQIDLPSTLINRFDLIFPIRDIPNKEKDEKIALHVLEAIHKEETYASEVTPAFLKKYLAYVKMNVYPKMTKAAINEIKDFYVNLRNSGRESDDGVRPIPISARQLEALIRLAEASARVRLDSKVSREDARRAIELLKYCLMQVGFDPETGKLDIDMIASGITASTRNRIGIIKDIIEELTKAGVKEIPTDELIAKAVSKGIEESKVEEVLEQLSRNGEIFEPKRGFIKKV